MREKPTIKELEKLLNDPEDHTIEIMPDGSITTNKSHKGTVLTKGLDIGDSY